MIALAASSRDDGLDVEGVVSHFRDLRGLSQRRRYSGPAPSLPSRKTVVTLFDELVSAIYPRHFGPQDLAAHEVDAFVAKSLRSAQRALQGQISWSLRLTPTRAATPPR